MRKEYTNETVLLTYTHSDGTDHRKRIQALEAHDENLVEKSEGRFTPKGLWDKR